MVVPIFSFCQVGNKVTGLNDPWEIKSLSWDSMTYERPRILSNPPVPQSCSNPPQNSPSHLSLEFQSAPVT